MATAAFQICWHTECSTLTHHLLGFEIAQLEFHHSPLLGSASQSNHARKSMAVVNREEGASDQHGFIGVLASTGQGSVEIFKGT